MSGYAIVVHGDEDDPTRVFVGFDTDEHAVTWAADNAPGPWTFAVVESWTTGGRRESEVEHEDSPTVGGPGFDDDGYSS